MCELIDRLEFDKAVQEIQDSLYKPWPYQSIITGVAFSELLSVKLFGKRVEREGLN